MAICAGLNVILKSNSFKHIKVNRISIIVTHFSEKHLLVFCVAEGKPLTSVIRCLDYTSILDHLQQ